MFQRWKGNKGMKYKLLKDTPTIKAGTIFEEIVNMSDGTRELSVAVPGEDIPQDPQFTIQDIDNFDEWFEEMEEPTDSVRRTPKKGEKYFYVDEYGNVECEEARDRRLAEVRLRKTSDFKPDFENGKGGWIVEYDYAKHRLAAWRYPFENSGEPVRYETEEDAKKSIEENREDWLTYFGIEEN